MRTAYILMRRLVGVTKAGEQLNIRQIAATVDHWCSAKGINNREHRLEIFGRMCDALYHLHVKVSS